ncbi:MAG: hypothetical protein ACFFDI_05190 [Promethearchaeota archaeon]
MKKKRMQILARKKPSKDKIMNKTKKSGKSVLEEPEDTGTTTLTECNRPISALL